MTAPLPGPRLTHPAVRYAKLQPPERHLLLTLEARGGDTTEHGLTGVVGGEE